MSAPRNGLASTSAEVPDLTRRHGAGYSHTPDYRASSETVRQEEEAATQGGGPSNGPSSAPCLGAAIKVQPSPSAGRRRSRSSDSQGGSRSASSTSSSEEEDEEGLLPSFGRADDDDPILAKHKSASPLLLQKSSQQKHNEYGDGTPSASTTSLGLNAHAQSGFTSRDDDLALDRRRMHDDGSEGQLGAEKRRTTGKGKAVKGKGTGTGKRPSWKERERQRTRAFAREMAFVVRLSALPQFLWGAPVRQC